jgi:pSer/pThr/pTyr-binding forkhead associated (FHA) protein
MPKLVVLSEGLTGRTHELKAEKTTIGRVEDNSFQVPDPSVSSHHCEVMLRGTEVVVRDLSSTNGSFINNQPITEAVLKPSQILRLGQVEIRLEADVPTAAQQKKVFDHTQVVPQGIKLTELDQTARMPVAPAFGKKSNRGTKIFLIVSIVAALVLIGFIIYVITKPSGAGP